MKVQLTIKGVAMLAAMAGAAISIAAHAQQAGGVLIDEKGNVVREAPRPTETLSQTISQSRSESTLNDGKNIVKASVENGVATISLNGEVVATKRMGEDWQSFEVKDQDGHVIATIARHGDHVSIGNGLAPEAFEALAVRPTWTRGYGVVTPSEPPAKVMMGITMDMPSQQTAEQLGINPEETTLVASVRDGMPAAAAGLKAYDVIVSVDGQKPATQQTIRQLLREKNAGDELKFEVLRRGEQKEVVIKLEAYDPERLGSGMSWNYPVAPTGQGGVAGSAAPFFVYRRSFNERSEQLQKQMAELSAQMAETSSRLGAAAGQEAQKLGAELATLGSEIAAMARELAEEMQEQGPMIREDMLQIQGQLGNEMRRLFIVPPSPAAPAAPGEPSGSLQREAELRAQNEALRAQIDAMKADRDAEQAAIEARMAKIEQMMQKVAEGKGGGQ